MKKRIKISSAKAKGRKLQQWVCQQISDLTGITCGKDELIDSREMGQSGVDVKLIGEAKFQFPYSVECKSQEAWSIPEWVKQAKANQKEETDWLLVCKRSNEKPIIIMDAEEFFRIQQTIVGHYKECD